MELFIGAFLLVLGMLAAVALFPLIVAIVKGLVGLIGILVLAAVVFFAVKALVKQLPGKPESGP